MRKYEFNLSRILTSALRQHLQNEVASEISQCEAIRKGIHFDQPTSVKNAEVKAANYHYVFCSHNIPYWRVCGGCGRDKDLAKRNADLVLRSIGGAAFFTK